MDGAIVECKGIAVAIKSLKDNFKTISLDYKTSGVIADSFEDLSSRIEDTISSLKLIPDDFLHLPYEPSKSERNNNTPNNDNYTDGQLRSKVADLLLNNDMEQHDGTL